LARRRPRRRCQVQPVRPTPACMRLDCMGLDGRWGGRALAAVARRYAGVGGGLGAR
jgi:hypothetical protein